MYMFYNIKKLNFKIMKTKNFELEEKQIQEICDKIRTADNIDLTLTVAFFDLAKIVRQAYYSGHDAGVARMTEIQAKNQELISNLFKPLSK